MKKVIGFNASPRKNWNTAQAVEKALEGARAAGAETKMVQLYGLSFKGCASCFACKKMDNPAAVCILKDEARPLLEEAMSADALIFGAPIYFGHLEPALLAFLERLFFMNYTYDRSEPSKFQGRIATGLISTMNVPEKMMQEIGYSGMFDHYTSTMKTILRGPSEWLAITDTMQFSSYDKYMHGVFDPDHKKKVHDEQFPEDLEKAFALGKRLAS